LTQQLTRSAFQLTGRTLDRKALEAVLARRIDAKYSKQQILELYVNRVYFGAGFYGIETAARGYFGKPAADLTLSESALLAGIIRSPNRLSPLRDMDGALAQRDAVLDRMVELRMITVENAQSAKDVTPTLTHQVAMRFEDDYLMDAVKREVERLLPHDVIDFGGLRIFTTIDPALQQLAQNATDRRLTEIEQGKNFGHPKKADFTPSTDPAKQAPTNYLQAALVAIDNRTGAIRAIVGGRDYAQSKYSRALLSKRQIGSTFKPFVYGAAFRARPFARHPRR
jgi:penicillin-binding protein 1A